MTLDELANKVCGELPEGHVVTICLERGAGWIEIENMDLGEMPFDDDMDAGIEAAFWRAVGYVKARAAGKLPPEDEAEAQRLYAELRADIAEGRLTEWEDVRRQLDIRL